MAMDSVISLTLSATDKIIVCNTDTMPEISRSIIDRIDPITWLIFYFIDPEGSYSESKAPNSLFLMQRKRQKNIVDKLQKGKDGLNFKELWSKFHTQQSEDIETKKNKSQRKWTTGTLKQSGNFIDEKFPRLSETCSLSVISSSFFANVENVYSFKPYMSSLLLFNKYTGGRHLSNDIFLFQGIWRSSCMSWSASY